MLAVAGGFVEVFDNHVRVLADQGEIVAEVQTDRARQDLEQANEALKKADNQASSEAALNAIKHAQARIDAAAKLSGRAS